MLRVFARVVVLLYLLFVTVPLLVQLVFGALHWDLGSAQMPLNLTLVYLCVFIVGGYGFVCHRVWGWWLVFGTAVVIPIQGVQIAAYVGKMNNPLVLLFLIAGGVIILALLVDRPSTWQKKPV